MEYPLNLLRECIVHVQYIKTDWYNATISNTYIIEYNMNNVQYNNK